MKLWTPPESNNVEEWESFYDQVATYVDRYSELANPIGIRLVPEKQKILITDATFFKTPHVSRVTLNVVRDGLVITGAPIGTQAFIDEHAKAKLIELKKRFEAIRTLATRDSQTAVKILEGSGSNSLNFYCSVVPPSKIEQLIQDFDVAIMDTFITCISLTDETLRPACNPARFECAKAIVELPHRRHGGFNFIPLKIKAPAAFVSTLIAQGDEPVLRDLLTELHDVAAYAEVCRTLSATGLDHLSDEDPAALVLPLTPEDLTSGPFAQEASLSNPRARSVIVKIAMDLKRNTLRPGPERNICF